MRRLKNVFVAASALISAGFIGTADANAATVLTFEGVKDGAQVGSFYAPEYEFSGSTIALVDSDNGGSGNFANEPSSGTIMAFLNANNAILNVVNGFTTGFSFFYSSSTAANVTVWSGLNRTGSLLGTIALTPQHTTGCSGDPSGTFCNWTNAGVSFAGTASSIDFGGTANQTGFDDITFGSAVAGAVPEPTTWMLMLIGMAGVGFSMRRKEKQTVRVRFA
jgi:PEP-CTERM motif